jgi:hypothetical protein
MKKEASIGFPRVAAHHWEEKIPKIEESISL